jgi:hypothetical protein
MALRRISRRPTRMFVAHVLVDLGAELAGEGHEAFGGELTAVGADGDPAGTG